MLSPSTQFSVLVEIKLFGWFSCVGASRKITRGRTDDDSHTKEKQDSLLVIVLQQWEERQKDPVEIDLN